MGYAGAIRGRGERADAQCCGAENPASYGQDGQGARASSRARGRNSRQSNRSRNAGSPSSGGLHTQLLSNRLGSVAVHWAIPVGVARVAGAVSSVPAEISAERGAVGTDIAACCLHSARFATTALMLLASPVRSLRWHWRNRHQARPAALMRTLEDALRSVLCAAPPRPQVRRHVLATIHQPSRVPLDAPPPRSRRSESPN